MFSQTKLFYVVKTSTGWGKEELDSMLLWIRFTNNASKKLGIIGYDLVENMNGRKLNIAPMPFPFVTGNRLGNSLKDACVPAALQTD